MGFIGTAIRTTRALAAVKGLLSAINGANAVTMRPDNPSTRDEVLEAVAKISAARPDFPTEEGSVARTVCDMAGIQAAMSISSCLLFAGMPEEALAASEIALGTAKSRIADAAPDTPSGKIHEAVRRSVLSAKFRCLPAGDPGILPLAFEMASMGMEPPPGQEPADRTKPGSIPAAAWAGETALAFFLAGNTEKAVEFLRKAIGTGGESQLVMETGNACPVPYRESLPAEYRSLAVSIASSLGLAASPAAAPRP